MQGLSKTDATRLAQLAAAIQADTESATSTTTHNTQLASGEARDSVAPVESQPAVIEPLPLGIDPRAEAQRPPNAEAENSASLLGNTYSMEALRDSLYEADAPSEINSIIRALKSHNWYTQNPAIQSIQGIRQASFDPSSWFVLGRNIYQAACGNSQKSMEYIGGLETQLKHFPLETAKHLLAGILFEIYFDAQGILRDRLKFSYADIPLSLVTQGNFVDVSAFIRDQLKPHSSRFKFLPGDKESMKLCITTKLATNEAHEEGLSRAKYLLCSIKLSGVELLVHADEPLEHRNLVRFLRALPMSLRVLKAQVSESFAIPKWALAIQFEPTVPSDAEFVLPQESEL